VDRIKEQMDNLAELNDEAVVELQSSILSEFESVEKETPTPQTVDAMTSLADMLDGVRNEIKRREAAVQELAKRAAEAANRVYGEDGEKESDMEEKSEEAPMTDAPVAPAEEAPAEEAPVSETPAPVEEEKKMEEAAEMPVAPTEETPSDKEEEEKKKEEKPMTEASTNAEQNAEFSTETTEVIAEAPATEVAAVEETVVAAAEEVVAETTPAAEAAVAEAFSKRIHALRRVNGGDGEQHIVASVTTQYPEERTLHWFKKIWRHP